MPLSAARPTDLALDIVDLPEDRMQVLSNLIAKKNRDAAQCLLEQKHNHVTTTYFLLERVLRRGGAFPAALFDSLGEPVDALLSARAPTRERQKPARLLQRRAVRASGKRTAPLSS